MSDLGSSEKEKKTTSAPLASFMHSHPFFILFLQLLNQGSADVPALQAEVTRVREATAAMEATRIVVVFAIETSAQKAAAAWDSTALHVKDAEDRAVLAEREAWERVSRVEVENAVALASAQEDAEGLVQKIAFLECEIAEEHRARELVGGV
jgi:hypothetical protein